MIKHINKSVTLSEAEIKSLKRLLTACRATISSLPSDTDCLAWDTYTALCMWDDKLRGRKNELIDYVDVDTHDVQGYAEETASASIASTLAAQTVDTWLVRYGSKKEKAHPC